METKFSSLKNVVRFLTITLCICYFASLASCDPIDPVEPVDPVDSIDIVDSTDVGDSTSVLDSLYITTPTVLVTNRTITDKAGEYSYSDKADAVIKMIFKNADPPTKDSAITIDLISKVAWPTTITKAIFEGGLVLTPTLTGKDTISVKYGTFEINNLFTISNTSFEVTVDGKTAEMPFFGFNKIEAVGNATNEITYVTEDGKDLEINTLTQAFKLSHSDGTTKELEIVVLEAIKDVTVPERVLIGYEELKDKFWVETESYEFVFHYTVRRYYSVGEPSDTTFTYKFDPQFDLPNAPWSYRFAQLELWPDNLVFEAEEIVESVEFLSGTNVTDNLQVDLYKQTTDIWFKYQVREEGNGPIVFLFTFPKVLKYSEKNIESINLTVYEPEFRAEEVIYELGSVPSQTIFRPRFTVYFGDGVYVSWQTAYYAYLI